MAVSLSGGKFSLNHAFPSREHFVARSYSIAARFFLISVFNSSFCFSRRLTRSPVSQPTIAKNNPAIISCFIGSWILYHFHDFLAGGGWDRLLNWVAHPLAVGIPKGAVFPSAPNQPAGEAGSKQPPTMRLWRPAPVAGRP